MKGICRNVFSPEITLREMIDGTPPHHMLLRIYKISLPQIWRVKSRKIVRA